MSDNEISDLKDSLKKDMEDPVFGAAMAPPGMPPGAPPGMPPGEPPGPPMEGQENVPPTALESLDYDSMKELAIESDCDAELIKILEDMKAKDHFNKISSKDMSK